METFLRSLGIVAFALSWCDGACVHSQDQITSRLEKQTEDFYESIEKNDELINKWFASESEKARKLSSGSTEAVKRIEEEKRQYDEKHTIPERAPLPLRLKRKQLFDKMVSSYKAAADQYTNQKNDAKAKEVLNSLKLFEDTFDDAKFRPIIGTWAIKYRIGLEGKVTNRSNGASFHDDEKPRKETGTIKVDGKSFVLYYTTFVEVWTPQADGRKCTVDHYHPATLYPTKNPSHYGTATRQ